MLLLLIMVITFTRTQDRLHTVGSTFTFTFKSLTFSVGFPVGLISVFYITELPLTVKLD